MLSNTIFIRQTVIATLFLLGLFTTNAYIQPLTDEQELDNARNFTFAEIAQAKEKTITIQNQNIEMHELVTYLENLHSQPK